MAPRKRSKSKLVAKLVTGEKVPCSFCLREVDNEIVYGKLYAIGDIQCHYFCVLLSSCLIQKGKDEDGLFGFIYEDIVNEIERAKKHKCSYCSHGGATLGCSVSQCRKQFHLPCGRERNAVSLFYGNYKSFCQLHAPKQNIPSTIMVKAKQRMICDNKMKRTQANFKDLKELFVIDGGDDGPQVDAQSVCVICYEAVEGYPTLNTFWPPCCARDAWFHRSCLQRMALSAGMHYLKCPLCNDKENFYQAVVTQGYYVPDRDAAWELEQNAFAEIYDREVSCSAEECKCPMGRTHDADQGWWCIKLCLLCGSSGVHAACGDTMRPHVCGVCTPAAPTHIDQLASCIQAVITQEQQQTSSRVRRGPVMPSRMSLRRTKRHIIGHNMPSCSSSGHNTIIKTEIQSQIPTANTNTSRQDLNLKTPKRENETDSKQNILENTTFNNRPDFKSPSKVMENSDRSLGNVMEKFNSPMKLLEESLRTKIGCNDVVVDEKLVEELRKRFRVPKPLSEKRKIVNDIINGVYDSLLKEPKQKEPILQWCSPKKCDIKQEIIEILDETPPLETDENSSKKSNDPENTDNCFKTPENPPSTNVCQASKAPSPNIYPIFNTPKKLKTIDILKDSSLEISAKDEIINIDMIKLENCENKEFIKTLELKIPERNKKCAFKFSPYDKEILDTDNVDIDMESFKDQYLHEVGLQRVRKENKPKSSKKRSRKRNLDDDEVVLQYSSKKRKQDRKKISIKDKNIKLKIKWRKERLRLKITDGKKLKKTKKYKQFLLQYSNESTSSISKPKSSVSPIKRKYIKHEKTQDNLVQTSIQKFFKVQSPKE